MIFAVPEDFSLKRVESVMAGGMEVSIELLEDTRRYYLDTFDWRLFQENMVLEAEVRGGSCTLIWRGLGSGKQFLSRSVRKLPQSAADFHNAGLQPRLKQILGRRTLSPRVSLHGAVTRLRLLNNDAKCVMRVELRSDKVISYEPPAYMQLNDYLCLFPYRGYEDIYDRRLRKLKKKLPLHTMERDPALQAFDALGLHPGEYTARPQFDFDPKQSATEVLGVILQRYQQNMECNVQGAREDVDPEHLHDFLVALRRIKSVITRFSDLLPPDGQELLLRDLKWVEESTTGIRDLDIFMTLFEEFTSAVDVSHREALNSLYSYLDDEKKEGIWGMRISLESTRYINLMSSLQTFIVSCQEQSEKDRKRIHKAASQVILEIYGELRREAKSLAKDVNSGKLLALFQTSKQLGYHMDMFSSVFPQKEMADLLEDKRKLQRRLNRFRDMDLQHRRLKAYKKGMAESKGKIEVSMQALEQLINDRKSEKRSARNRALDQIGSFTRKKMNRHFRAMFANSKGGKG